LGIKYYDGLSDKSSKENKINGDGIGRDGIYQYEYFCDKIGG
jgi:hypothetical protein